MDNIKSDIKTMAVKNRNIAMELIKKGHELLNVSKGRETGLPVYIFEDTQALKTEFDKLVLELVKDKNKDVLTDAEKAYIVEMLDFQKFQFTQLGIVKMDTIDRIISKLSKKEKEEKIDV